MSRLQERLLRSLSERFSEAVRPFDLDVLGRGLLKGLVRTFRYSGISLSVTPERLFQFEGGVAIALFPRGLGHPAWDAVFRLPAALWRLLTVDPGQWYERERLPLVQEATDLELVVSRPDLCSDRELLRTIDRAASLAGEGFYSRRRYFQSFVLAYLVRAWVRRLAGDDAPELYADLMSGISHATASANRMLFGLALSAAEDSRIEAALDAPDPAAVLEGTAYLGRFERFLNEFGSRELSLFGPSWREEPAVVWSMLRSMVRRPTPAAAADRSGAGLRHALTLVRSPLRPAFRWLLRKARALEALREDTHFLMMRPFPIGRAAALELGRRFVNRGLLQRADDALFLVRNEIEGAVRDGAPSLSDIAVRRRALYLAVREDGLVPTEWFPLPGSLHGVPASGGTAEGTARLISSPADFRRLQAGDILVCRYTNPAWTPLFSVAAGVVAETGGMAAHAAIVAREYRIPAVMGVGGATSLIKDGQSIRLDGSTGEVMIIKQGRQG